MRLAVKIFDDGNRKRPHTGIGRHRDFPIRTQHKAERMWCRCDLLAQWGDDPSVWQNRLTTFIDRRVLIYGRSRSFPLRNIFFFGRTGTHTYEKKEWLK